MIVFYEKKNKIKIKSKERKDKKKKEKRKILENYYYDFVEKKKIK